MDDSKPRLLDEQGKPLADPLVSLGFRFDAKSKVWRRVVRFHKNMPSNTHRKTVADEAGLSEDALQAWEEAIVIATVEVSSDDPAALLAVVDGHPVHLDPLRKWAFQYFPQSKIWRRTRSHRNEVSREDIAKKVGVPEALVEAWESAADKNWATKQVDATQ